MEPKHMHAHSKILNEKKKSREFISGKQAKYGQKGVVQHFAYL